MKWKVLALPLLALAATSLYAADPPTEAPIPHFIQLVTAQPPTLVSTSLHAISPEAIPSRAPGHLGGYFMSTSSVEGAATGTPSYAGYSVGLYSEAVTSAAGTHMYAANFLVQRRPGDPRSLQWGLEINTNNLAETDGRDQWPNMMGLVIMQGGTYSPRSAMYLATANLVPFRNGIDIQDGSVSDFVFRYGNRFQVHTNGRVWVDRGEGRGQEELVPKAWLDALAARVSALEAQIN